MKHCSFRCKILFVALLWISTIGLILLIPNPTHADQDEDPLLKMVVQMAPNMEPTLMHPVQAAEVKEKLAALEKKFGKKPNILIYLMDDLGWGDPGVYGGGKAVGAPTPNMDRLAREGLQLTSTYAQPSCTPTRATIMTGRLPIRTGLLRPPMYGEKGGLEGEITLAQILSQAGYVTQAVGKWHMGENEESQPQNVGFDDFYGFLSVSDMYTEWRDPYFFPEIANSPERTALIKMLPFNRHLVHVKKGGKVENLDEITIPILSQLDQKWANYSIDFIKKMAKEKNPFFLYHCTRAPHFDNYPNEQFKAKSPAKHPYKDVVVEIDDILGRLVATLKETGQMENTLVFITSDNGPEMETWPDSGYTPFRSAKGSTWEGGVRVPAIVYWPGLIKPGRVSDGLFDLADLFNTSVTLAGAQANIPKDRFVDGIDQSSFLLADNGQSNRKFIYYWLQNKFSALRVGEWKLMLAGTQMTPGDTVNPGGFSGYTVDYTYAKFFNLYMDPKEEHSYMIRKLAYIDAVGLAFRRHLATFKKYPPKNVMELQR